MVKNTNINTHSYYTPPPLRTDNTQRSRRVGLRTSLDDLLKTGVAVGGCSTSTLGEVDLGLGTLATSSDVGVIKGVAGTCGVSILGIRNGDPFGSPMTI